MLRNTQERNAVEEAFSLAIRETTTPERIARQHREMLNGHPSYVLWFTGLSGSGKSTLAQALEREMHAQGIRTYILDGDVLRTGLNSDLGFSEADRRENIRRVGHVSRVLTEAGVVVLVALISPFEEDRRIVRDMYRAGEFVEVFVDCPLDVCEERDPKGLYQKALAGLIPQFTGISSPYEAPTRPELHLHTDRETLETSLNKITAYLRQHEQL
jgi:adenylyl-sulfate kinase